jgi:hypothetical protein
VHRATGTKNVVVPEPRPGQSRRSVVESSSSAASRSARRGAMAPADPRSLAVDAVVPAARLVKVGAAAPASGAATSPIRSLGGAREPIDDRPQNECTISAERLTVVVASCRHAETDLCTNGSRQHRNHKPASLTNRRRELHAVVRDRDTTPTSFDGVRDAWRVRSTSPGLPPRSSPNASRREHSVATPARDPPSSRRYRTPSGGVIPALLRTRPRRPRGSPSHRRRG